MHTSKQPLVHYLRYLSAEVFAPSAASLSLCQPCFAIIYQQVSDQSSINNYLFRVFKRESVVSNLMSDLMCQPVDTAPEIIQITTKNGAETPNNQRNLEALHLPQTDQQFLYFLLLG